MKKVFVTNVISVLHIYIIPMQINMYVFIAYQKINHFINKYFGYVCKTANYKNKLFMRLYKELIALNIDLRQIHILVLTIHCLSGLNIRISIFVCTTWPTQIQ